MAGATADGIFPHACLQAKFTQTLTQVASDMRELTESEAAQVSGGLGPVAVMAIDLALDSVLIAYAAFRRFLQP